MLNVQNVLGQCKPSMGSFATRPIAFFCMHFYLFRNRPHVKWRAFDLSPAWNHVHRVRINNANASPTTQVPGAPQRWKTTLHNAPFCPRACFERKALRNDARLILTRLRDVRSRKPNSKISNGNNEHFHAMLPLNTLCKFANFAISHTCCNWNNLFVLWND